MNESCHTHHALNITHINVLHITHLNDAEHARLQVCFRMSPVTHMNALYLTHVQDAEHERFHVCL